MFHYTGKHEKVDCHRKKRQSRSQATILHLLELHIPRGDARDPINQFNLIACLCLSLARS